MPDSPRWRRSVAPAALLALGLATSVQGCGGDSGPVTLTVLAASSLTEVLGELGTAYRQTHRQVWIQPVFGGSQEVAGRLSDHGQADVLVTADEESMGKTGEFLTGRRRIVAHNSMTIAVAPGNPKRISGLDDLSRPGLRVTIGAAMVPAGRYARQIFTRAGLRVKWSSEEISARAVLDRVRSGRADAGLVYITDMRSAGVAAASVPIAAADNVTASYPAAAVKDGDHQEEAAAFVTWLASPEAARLFNKLGFATPTAPR